MEPEYVPVTNKRITDFNDQVSVRGEQNARFVGFQLPRYDDGLDLTAAHLYIHYQTVYGGSDSVPCNVSWSDNHVRLCWQVPAQSTQEPDRVQMMIYATGTNSMGERVTWKTLPASYTIHDGLDIGGGIPEPDTSWYEQFVAQMEGKVSTAQGYANDAQASRTAAAGSAAESAQSAAASAKALEDNRAYVESQKETFVGYNKRETDLKYANALIGTASGMGRVTVGDAWEAPIPDLEIAGMSGQFSTTGAQMLDIPSLSARTSNGVTFTPNPDGAILATGTATGGNSTFYLSDRLSVPSGDYYISGCPDGGDKSTYVIKGYINTSDGTSYAYAYDIGDGDTLTVKDGQTLSLAITIDNNASGPLVFRPMLHAGSTPKPWEPYTGGKPSPSPEYPQPIISTGTVSTGAQMLDVTVTGTQLLDLSAVSNGAGGATVNAADGGYTISGTGTLTTTFGASYRLDVKRYLRPGNLILKSELTIPKLYIRIWDGNTVLAEMQGNSTKQITQDILDNENVYIECFLHGNTGSAITPGTYYPMLYQDGDGTWQPYHTSTAAITLTEPLRGIGDVRDRIMCRDGVWGIERYVALRELTEGIVYSNRGGQVTPNNIIDNRYVAIWTDNYKGIISKTAYADNRLTAGYCNIAGAGKVGEWNKASGGKENIYTINSNGSIFVTVPIGVLGIGVDVGIDEVNAAVKQYVADHDVYVMFERATPTWEPLPSAAQSALNALTTYTGTTHVTITAGGPEPDVGLGYVQDTRAVIADLQAQINEIRNGGTI